MPSRFIFTAYNHNKQCLMPYVCKFNVTKTCFKYSFNPYEKVKAKNNFYTSQSHHFKVLYKFD